MTTDKSFSQFSSTGMKGRGGGAHSPMRKNLSDNGNRILMNSGTGVGRVFIVELVVSQY